MNTILKDFIKNDESKDAYVTSKVTYLSLEDVEVLLNRQAEQLSLPVVSKSLPTEDCVRDWWRAGKGDKYFWKHETDWTNEQVFREIYQALAYFIKRWQ